MRYAFYPGCAYDGAAGYAESVNAVCDRLGITLAEIPGWNCCGATTFFSRDQDAALLLAGRVLALGKAFGDGQIITICNACYTTLRKAWQILKSDNAALSRVNAALATDGLHLSGEIQVRHLLDLLVHDLPAAAWPGAVPPPWQDLQVAAYYGCQLTRPFDDLDHAQHPRLLETFLQRLGFSVVAHSAATTCCGSSHAVPYADACRPLIQRIANEIKYKGADVITTICPLCQFNLDTGQMTPRLPVTFFTQLAGLALGLPPHTLGLSKLLTPLVRARS